MNQSPTCRSGIRCRRLAIAFGLSLAAYSVAGQAADPVFSVVGALTLDEPSQTGMVMNTYHFGLNRGGPGYSATLTNTGLFGAGPIGMTLLRPSMKLLGSQIGSGTFGFSANEPGNYTRVVAGKPATPADLDVYAAQVAAVPEPAESLLIMAGLGSLSLIGRRGRSRAAPIRRL